MFVGRFGVGGQHRLHQIQFVAGQLLGLLGVILLRLGQRVAGIDILLTPAVENHLPGQLGHLVLNPLDGLAAGAQVAETGESSHLAL